MSYLDYYRQNPAWATNQWQSVAPPMPSFQPQPSWGGYDYFKSAVGSMNVDPNLYTYGLSSFRNASSAMSIYGTSMAEAKTQHRRAYGGLGDILVMTPQEIGAAAAYEVWRNWRYHNGILAQPLAGDVSRQREALIGLAIGESAKLWQYTRRHVDSAGQAAAAETAALAAAHIFDEGNDALMRAGGAYGSLGSTSLSGALSPVLGPVGGYQYGGTTYDPMGASLAAPGFARRRSASFGGIPPSPYAAGPPPPASAYTGSDSGLYGGANGMLGAGYDGYVAGRPLARSRPASPVYPVRPLSAMGGAASYAGSVVDDPFDRRLTEHELRRRDHLAQRAELSARRGSRYGYDGMDDGYGDYEYEPEYPELADERLGGSYRRGYDDIYGDGRRRPLSGYGGSTRRERFDDGYY